MEIIKKHLVGFIVGICLIITAGSVYLTYTLTKKVAVHEQAIQQIITFINQATQPK